MLRDYEVELLEEMVKEEQYQKNIPLATNFVVDFLEAYKHVISQVEQLKQALNKACNELERFDMTFNNADYVDIKNSIEWKEWCMSDE